MKNWLVIFFICVGVHGWGQEDSTNLLNQFQLADSTFKNLNYSSNTGFLYNRLMVDDTLESVTWNTNEFLKLNSDVSTNADYFYQFMYEMKLMSIDSSLVPDRMNIYDSASIYLSNNEFETEQFDYPFAIVDFKYENIDIQTNINSSLIYKNGIVYYPASSNSNLIVEERRAKFACPTFDYFSSDSMGIIFRTNDFYSNHKSLQDIAQIKIKVNGNWNVLVFDQLFKYIPNNTEYQEFTIKITYTDSSSFTNTSKIYTPELFLKDETKSNSFPGCDLDGTINHDGDKLKWCMIGRCDYDGRILKPYLLLTGYRPPLIGQSFKKTWKLYNDEHGSLLNSLRDNNYDIFIVKFNIHARPYKHGMEESANLLVSFIEFLNNQKNASKGHENIIQGSSMSADIARLALLKMEKKHLEDNSYDHHHSRLFMAYDANFYGANLPLAYQFQIYSAFKYPAVILSFGAVSAIQGFLSTFMFATLQQKAVKELLMYHATATDDNLFNYPYYHANITPTHHWRRQGYYNALNAVDNGVHIFPMPLATRNISISLGKIQGTNNVNDDGSSNQNYPDPGEYWKNINLVLWKFRIRAGIYTNPGDNAELFWRKKIGFSAGSAYVNHRIHVTQMQEIDNASGSFLSGTGNLISISNWAYFALPNLFDGQDFFSHKSVVTALGINKNLWPSDGSMTLNMKSLGLMFNTFSFDPNNPNDYSNYYGYPNLGRPNDHFEVTPFEAIYVDNKINPHILLEDDEPADLAELNGFILNEVEPWYLGLQNQSLGSKARSNYRYASYRRAKELIVVGNLVTPTTDQGDYNVEANGSLILKSGGEINIKTGVHFKQGSIVHIVPEYNACDDTKSTTQNNQEQPQTNYISDEISINKEVEKLVQLFPNPNNGEFQLIAKDGNKIIKVSMFDLRGELKYQISLNEQQVLINKSVSSGMYLIQITTELGVETHKIQVL